MTRIFKVVAATYEDNQVTLQSAWMNMLGDHRVYYRQGVKAVPLDGSYLYAFSSLDAAKKYADLREIGTPYMVLQVWEAEGDLVPVSEPVQMFGDTEQFWEENLFGLDLAPKGVNPCPDGTVWCHSITLKHMLVGHNPANPRKKEREKQYAKNR